MSEPSSSEKCASSTKVIQLPGKFQIKPKDGGVANVFTKIQGSPVFKLKDGKLVAVRPKQSPVENAEKPECSPRGIANIVESKPINLQTELASLFTDSSVQNAILLNKVPKVEVLDEEFPKTEDLFPAITLSDLVSPPKRATRAISKRKAKKPDRFGNFDYDEDVKEEEIEEKYEVVPTKKRVTKSQETSPAKCEGGCDCKEMIVELNKKVDMMLRKMEHMQTINDRFHRSQASKTAVGNDILGEFTKLNREMIQGKPVLEPEPTPSDAESLALTQKILNRMKR